MVDVLTAAWTAAGEPGRTHGAGLCARCGKEGASVPVRRVVSRNFTGWDGWDSPTGSGLCAACAWAYRTPELRLQTLEVRRGPAKLRRLDPSGLALVLSEPIAATLAVTLPLRGRKHLLPAAQWGRICVDDVCIPWGSGDVERLAIMQGLRRLGFGPRMLSEPVPHYGLLRDLPADRRVAVIEQWRALAPWRQRLLWLKVAVAATNPPKPVSKATQAAGAAA